MRELVLNHASLVPAGWHQIVEWLPDMANGIAALIRCGAAQKILRASRSEHEVRWPDNRSLFDAYRELQSRGARDQSAFLMCLSAKVPLLGDVEQDITDRFVTCEMDELPGEAGGPLLFCALTDAIAVSVPSEPRWDRDRILITFDELLPDLTFDDAEETIDNLARLTHAPPICDRHRQRLLRFSTNAADLWRLRGEVFPHLTFGPDVETQLARVNAGLLGTVVNRLGDLDATAVEWAIVGGNAPPWRTRVTPESGRVMNNPVLREARVFRSARGGQVVFEWHARFGNGGRIHLRFDAHSREIEIGYIGDHLPL